MAKAWVTFVQYYNVEVEVDDELFEEDPQGAEDEAFDKAYEDFEHDMSLPYAHTSYDEVEIEWEE